MKSNSGCLSMEKFVQICLNVGYLGKIADVRQKWRIFQLGILNLLANLLAKNVLIACQFACQITIACQFC